LYRWFAVDGWPVEMAINQNILKLLSLAVLETLCGKDRQAFAFSLIDPALTRRGSARVLTSSIAEARDGATTTEDTLTRQRKQRKNKYKNFSKVDELLDPQDKLIAESEKKNQDILTETKQARQKPRPETQIAPLPTVEYPDTKSIDVSEKNILAYAEVRRLIH
jgi:hypothetical protein